MPIATRSARRAVRGSVLVAAALALIGCARDADAVEDATGGAGVGGSQHATSGSETTASATPETCTLEPAYFAYDSSELDPGARASLERSARCLKRDGSRHVVVRGMTDPRGTEQYNLALGDRRAQAVKQYLTRLGVADGQLGVASAGEELAEGEDESGWARDRRAELNE